MPYQGEYRTYSHGGVLPLCPPGKVVKVKVGGSAMGFGLMSLVNFGPRELLTTNFRDVDDPEAHWARAIALTSELQFDRPKTGARLGDTWADYGGSHESLNFQAAAGAMPTSSMFGKFKFGWATALSTS